MLETVDKVEALDKYTVKFTLKEPYAWFLDALASTSTWIVAKECVEKFGDLKKVEAVDRHRPLDARALRARTSGMTFVRNPNYFVAGPALRRRRRDHDRRGPRLAASPPSSPASTTSARSTGMVVRRQRPRRAPSSASRASQTAEYIVVFGGFTGDEARPGAVQGRPRAPGARAWPRTGARCSRPTPGRRATARPNPLVPAALKEWSIPIDQLAAEGRKLYEHDTGRGQAAARRGRPSRTASRSRWRRTPGYGPDYMDARADRRSRTGRRPASTPSSS